jgi:hypothetical protein
MPSYPLEITRIALTVDRQSAVAAHYADEALLKVSAISLPDHSEASIIAAALDASPSATSPASSVEIAICRDNGDSVTTSTIVHKGA